MAIVNVDQGAIDQWLTAFANTITVTPVTTVVSGTSGEEMFTEGSPFNVQAPFFKRNDNYNMDKWGVAKTADAVVLYPPNATAVSRNDLITFGGEVFRIKEAEPRHLTDDTVRYYALELYLNNDE